MGRSMDSFSSSYHSTVMIDMSETHGAKIDDSDLFRLVKSSLAKAVAKGIHKRSSRHIQKKLTTCRRSSRHPEEAHDR